MNGSVTSPDMKAAIAALTTIDKGLAAEWRAHAKREVVVPWARELAAAAPAGTKGAAAGRSVKAGSGRLPTVRAGVGSWEGWVPFFATEFGMDHEKYRTYVRRSPKGTTHFVRRRTGTWAPVWKRNHGYWFHPYWDKHSDRPRGFAIKLVDDFIRRNL